MLERAVRTTRCVARALRGALAMLALVAAPVAPGATGVPTAAWTGVEDLSEIAARGELRVLVPVSFDLAGARFARPAHERELELVRRFAAHHGLETVFVPIERRSDLIPSLLGGRGDVLAAAFTVTDSRKSRIAFTAPVQVLRERLVVRRGDAITDHAALEGREVALREKSGLWPVLQEARKPHPGIQIRILPETTADDEVLAGVLDGKYDVGVVDGAYFTQHAADWPELKLLPVLVGGVAVALGVHPDATDLRRAINAFVRTEQLARPPRPVYREDLPGIRARGVLRVLTRNNATTYFIWRGELMGFEYDLIKRFADSQKLRLEMVVPPSRGELIPALLDGHGDVIAASITITDERRRMGLAFTTRYNVVDEVVVSRAGDPPLDDVGQLAGRTVVVRRSSSYWGTLEELRERGIDVRIVAAPEDLETEEIIARVATGEYDLTVADSHVLDVALTWRDDVRAALVLGQAREHGWAVRATDVELLDALDAFVAREYRQLFYNITYEKYFRNPRRIRAHVAQRAGGMNGNGLSPWDEIVRRHADANGIDWPLVVAVMYRESRFDPKARSWAGARGLLQMLPATARRFGISNLNDPEQSILAGIRYLAWIYGRFEDELAVRDRTWFTLAAYNAGIGHVRDARELARELGLDPDRWFGNVEEAMRLLSRRRYHRKSTHGYVRGIESVIYVREIRNLYDGYSRLLGRPAGATAFR